MKNFAHIPFLLLVLFITTSGFANDFIIVKDIQIIGNEKTKDYIVLRELSFKENDTIPKSELDKKIKESENNLINTSLFHFANIFVNDSAAAPYVKIEISLTERWYLWPVPVADIEERNFNSWWQTKSLSRLSAGINLSYLNSRGRMEQIRLSFLAGYNTILGLEYDFPYINSKKTVGLKIHSNYTRNHEVRLLTDSNKLHYLKLETENALEESFFGIGLKFRPNLYFTNEFNVSYLSYNIHDSIIKLNSSFSVNKASKLSFFYIYNKAKLDRRDFQSYPLHGYYADIELYKYGVGILENSPNVFSFKTTLRKYFQLSDKFYYAAGGVLKFSNSKSQAYLIQRGLGYGRDFVRGYEYYVVDGSGFFIFKSNLKYSLIPEKIYKVPFLKSEKFNTIPYSVHANIFCDIGKIRAHKYNIPTNFLDDDYLIGFGLGIDLVTYYDRVARFEYTFNKHGESGFYIHFIAPI